MQWVASSDHCRPDTVLPPSDHCCIETVAPSGDHYCIGIVVGYASGATISDMRRDARERERDREELPRLSPGVGCESTAQGDKVIVVPSSDHCGNDAVAPSSDHYGTSKVAQPSDHLHTKRT